MNQNSRLYRSQAVVLSRRDYGEADRLVTVFTPGLGKQEWIAKGIRKTTSRKAGHLEPFSHAALLIAKARTWDIVTEAATVESFRYLRTNLDVIAQATYLCELIAVFTEQDDDNLAIWDLLLLALRILDEQAHSLATQTHSIQGPPRHHVACDPPEPSDSSATVQTDHTPQMTPEAVIARTTLLLRWFEVHLLGLSGFQPQFFHCLGCHKPIEPVTNFLSLEDGGIFCPQCAAGRSDVDAIESNILKMLRHLQRSSWYEIQDLHIHPLVLSATETILYRYILTVLERQLKSVVFLRKLKSTLQPELTQLPTDAYVTDH